LSASHGATDLGVWINAPYFAHGARPAGFFSRQNTAEIGIVRRFDLDKIQLSPSISASFNKQNMSNTD
jgi:hypothetical protein